MKNETTKNLKTQTVHQTQAKDSKIKNEKCLT